MNAPFNAGEDAPARRRARETQTVYSVEEAQAGRAPGEDGSSREAVVVLERVFKANQEVV